MSSASDITPHTSKECDGRVSHAVVSQARAGGPNELTVGNVSHSLSVASLSSQWVERLEEIDATWNPSSWSKKLFEQELANQHAEVLGVFAGDVLIGYLIAHVVCDEAHIVSFGVHPAWRGKGAGKALLGHFVSYAKMTGVGAVTLEVRLSNLIAQAMYSSFGFQTAGMRVGYYSSNGETAVSMRLAVK